MARPPTRRPEEKIRIVLAVLPFTPQAKLHVGFT